MNTTFLLSGGAGRVVAAIPALEKYYKLNPHDDFKVLIYGWQDLYWSHPLLQSRTFNALQKGIFELVIKNSKLVVPEPYHVHGYYNQQLSLVQAFDNIINNTNDHSDLDRPNLYLDSNESNTAKLMISQAKVQNQKSKFLVYQPFGSGASLINNSIIDRSGRSLNNDDALRLGRLISNDAVVLFFGPSELIDPSSDFMLNANQIPGADLRFYMAMIANSDGFIGVDSVGQHMAYAFNKPGVVIMGSTFEQNVTYPNHFEIYRNDMIPTYNPIRIGGEDCEFADRANDNVMTFTHEQLVNISDKVKLL